jgi:hypothetical protein
MCSLINIVTDLATLAVDLTESIAPYHFAEQVTATPTMELETRDAHSRILCLEGDPKFRFQEEV